MALSRHSRKERPRQWVWGKHDYRLWLRLNPETDYSYLPLSYLLALAGRGKHATTRTADAACEPHCFLGRRDHIFKSSVTWLETNGFKELVKHGYLSGIPSRRNTFQLAHDLGACIAQAAIELGARRNGLQYLNWPALKTHPKMNPETATLKDPHVFTVTGGYHRFDRPPFILQTENDSIAFFIEYDRDTEDLGGSARITIEKKLKHIKEIWEKKLWKEKYNFTRALVLFVCTLDEDEGNPVKDRRQARIMQKTKEIIGDCPYILFQSMRDFERAMNSIKPVALEEGDHSTEHLLDMPWQRVGYYPFDLLKLRDATEGTPL